MNSTRFAHSLLFQCEACQGPIAISATSGDRSLEAVDGTAFKVSCNCGWAESDGSQRAKALGGCLAGRGRLRR
jgi:hypothetical protein